MASVLFVCTANQCRSPIAAALFKRRLAQHGLAAEWRVESAGTWARAGLPAITMAQAVMREWNIDLSVHRSRCVSRDLLHSFELILVMERGQQEALRIEFPGISERVYLLSEMTASMFDIPDPVAGPLAEVRAIAHEINLLLEYGFDQIIQLTTGIPALHVDTTAINQSRRRT